MNYKNIYISKYVKPKAKSLQGAGSRQTRTINLLFILDENLPGVEPPQHGRHLSLRIRHESAR
jgi:hypothetical protein